jgi:hypothetical protein
MSGKDGCGNAAMQAGAVEQALGVADPFPTMPASPSKPAR